MTTSAVRELVGVAVSSMCIDTPNRFTARVRVAAVLLFGVVVCLMAGPPDAFAEPHTRAVPAGWITTKRLLNAEREPGAWLTGGRDYQQSYYSPLTAVNRRNVAKLGFAWQYDIDTTDGFEATPIVVDGAMYASGPKGAVYALDAATGVQRWRFVPQIDPAVLTKVCCGIVNRGVAVWQGRVYVGALDGILYALNAQDGSIAWRADTITERDRGYTITGAPYVAADLVIIGNSGAEFDARGYVTAYDATTGERRWRFFTVPGDPSRGFEHPELEQAAKTWDPKSLWHVGLGGTVWDGMAYDPRLNLLYVGTGNAAPYPRKLRSPAGGDNLFLASILAINPATGRLVWHYQTTPADNWDFTSTQKLILADLPIGGRTRQVIMQAPKNGFFYVLDRRTGELIGAKPFVAVNWASHVDLATGRAVETGQGEYFHEPRLVFPSPAGGHNWQPMAFNPNTGLVYIPAFESGAIWTMPDKPFVYRKGGLNSAAEFVFPMRGEWGLDGEVARRLPPFAELARGQPDATIRGFLRAWDPVQQRLVWEVETSGAWVGSMFAFWNGGGVMTTAGGLVFQGRGSGELVALDAGTGQLLHSIDVGTSMMAAPMTYTVRGEQYVAIMAGLGGAAGQTYLPGTAAFEYGNRGRIVAFKLGGAAVPKRPRVQPTGNGPVLPAVPRRGGADQVQAGRELFLRDCAKCHSNTDGRSGGIPDLKRMSAATHEEFSDILLKGTRISRGMGNFSDLLSPDEVELVHVYLIELAWQALEEKRPVPGPHQPPVPHATPDPQP